MALCGEQTLYITPFVPLYLAPYSASGGALGLSSLSPESCVSVIVSNYRLRVRHIVTKSHKPVELPLTAIESVRHHRTGDCAWLAVKGKMTLAFRLVALNAMYNTAANVTEVGSPCTTANGVVGVVNSSEVLLRVLQAIQKALPRNTNDLFAFAYFSALKRLCAANTHAEEKRKSSLSNTGVVLRDEGASADEDGVDERGFMNASESRVVTRSLDICRGSDAGKAVEVGISNYAAREGESCGCAKATVTSSEPMGLHLEEADGLSPAARPFLSMLEVMPRSGVAELVPRAISEEHHRLQMHHGTSFPMCDDMSGQGGASNKSYWKSSCKEMQQLEAETRLRVIRGTNNNVGRCSIIDGGNQYDSAWYAYNLEEEFNRMTHLPQLLEQKQQEQNSSQHRRTKNGSNVTVAFKPELGVDISDWFHIIPLSRADLFSTYPFSIIVPRRVTVDLAERVAQYRHNGRIPSISWIHLETGATLSRAAQPSSGSHMSSYADALFCSFLTPAFQQPSNGAQRGLSEPSQKVVKADRVPKGQRSLLASTKESGGDWISTGVGKTNDTQPGLELTFDRDTSSCDSMIAPGSSRGKKTRPPLPFREDNDITDFRHTESEKGRLHFIDCRSRAVAAANFPTGGGYEIVRNYNRAEIHFLGLDNIHAVRATFTKLAKLCVTVQRNDAVRVADNKVPGSHFWTKLDGTGWPEMIVKIIWSSWFVAEKIVAGDSVLVHCTDGWDRTSQVVSLAMLQMDGYYRTVEGFCILIMREWLELGHRFGDRCANNRSGDGSVRMAAAGEDGNSPSVAATRTVSGQASLGSGSSATHNHGKSTQVSPVFVQFIDAVYQLFCLFPSEFEFTPRFLQYILDEVYSCRFGTFLYNCHRSRYRHGGVTRHTASFWGEVEELVRNEREDSACVPAQEKLLNPFYIHPEAHMARESTTTPAPLRSKYLTHRLVPNFMSCRYRFWQSLYCCYSFADMAGGNNVVCPGLEHLVPLIDSWLWHTVTTRRETTEGGQGEGKKNTKKYRLRTMFRKRIFITSHAARACGGLPNLNYDGKSAGGAAPPITPLLRPGDEHTLLAAPLGITTTSSLTAMLSVEGADSVSERSGSRETGFSYPVNCSPMDVKRPFVLSCGCGSCSDSSMPHRIEKENYMTRSKSKSCEVCAAPFTFFFRRHACRHCGRAVCSRCGGRFLRLPPWLICLYEERDATHAVRICSICYSKVIHHLTTSQRKL